MKSLLYYYIEKKITIKNINKLLNNMVIIMNVKKSKN